MFRKIVLSFISLIFPVECEVCGAVLSPLDNSGVCAGCEAGMQWIRPPHCPTCGRGVSERGQKCGWCPEESYQFDRAYACALYEGAVRELLHRYKFGGRKILGNFFVKAMRNFIQKNLAGERWDAIVSVPLDSKKRNTRGFNQSSFIASRLSKKIGVPDLSGRFLRKNSSTPQSLLSKKDRAANVKGCFSVRSGGNRLAGKKILLVDDILTSGQTASECARVLKEAGAAEVTVLTCARGL